MGVVLPRRSTADFGFSVQAAGDRTGWVCLLPLLAMRNARFDAAMQGLLPSAIELGLAISDWVAHRMEMVVDGRMCFSLLPARGWMMICAAG
ncbi:hypothetical protein ACLOJK_018738 [Asimina triloba]